MRKHTLRRRYGRASVRDAFRSTVVFHGNIYSRLRSMGVGRTVSIAGFKVRRNSTVHYQIDGRSLDNTQRPYTAMMVANEITEHAS